MKITNIDISNYAGVKSFKHAPGANVTLIAGFNGAGKSSIAEAINHALTGEAKRVQLKKDFSDQLLHAGTDAGHVIISTEDGEHGVTLPAGKVLGSRVQFIEYCTNASLFASLAPQDRRAVLLQLMGVKMDAASIAQEISKRGRSAENISAITAHLAGGFEAGHKEASAKARDAKTSWRTITGETYGEVKAASWRSVVPEYDSSDAPTADQIEAIESEVESLSVQIGQASRTNQQIESLELQLHAAKENGGRYARVQDKLAKDEKERDEWLAKVSEAEANASGVKPMSCPHCNGNVVHEHGLLKAFESHEPDAEAAANLPKYREALALLERAVANGKRDLVDADRAAGQVQSLQEQLDALTHTDTDEINEILRAKKVILQNMRNESAKHADHLKAVAGAEHKTATAMKYHKDVAAWDAIAKDLAPDGIQAELMGEALGKFNTALHVRSKAFEDVKINEDMSITYGDRIYSLRSESEQWRADAIIASAIAEISGIGFFMVDRFDVLDIEGRSKAIDFFARTNQQVIVLGTLKEPPAKLPGFMECVWVESGKNVNKGDLL